MTELNRSNSLDRNSELVVAAVYKREVAASLERVWENVFDWEHLPWLHSEAFNSIEKLASGDWGWRARVELAGEAKAEIELIADRVAGHYVARTFAGAGAPSEIWTSLDPVADDRTAIAVEFCVQPMPDEALRRIGNGYVSLYTILWDQDEGMMQTRERGLANRQARGGEADRYAHDRKTGRGAIATAPHHRVRGPSISYRRTRWRARCPFGRVSASARSPRRLPSEGRVDSLSLAWL